MPSLLVLCAAVVCTVPTFAYPGPWDYPLAGPARVVHAFAPPPQGQPWLRGNRGVDLVASPAETVRSAGAGVVTFAGPLAGRGVVVVDHGRLRTTYEPVSATVHVGEPVRVGQPIGRVEAVPSPCAPLTCLHWGLLRGSSYLDPMLLLGLDGPVRLLPWLSGGAALPRVPPPATPAAVPARHRADLSPGAGGDGWLAVAVAGGLAVTSLGGVALMRRPPPTPP